MTCCSGSRADLACKALLGVLTRQGWRQGGGAVLGQHRRGPKPWGQALQEEGRGQGACRRRPGHSRTPLGGEVQLSMAADWVELRMVLLLLLRL